MNCSLESKNLAKATFAGGCFWCMEWAFDQVDGVKEVKSGYTDGNKTNPSYEEVSSGNTGHTEAIQVLFDPEKVSYEDLVELFWKQIDPTDAGGQFADRGSQYRTGIYYYDEEQRLIAEKSKQKLNNSGKFDKPIVTEIKAASEFYEAEGYHQEYYKKEPVHYNAYKIGSGRDAFIKNTWKEDEYKKASKDELKTKLTDLQYEVTQNCGTEAPFDNEYWDNKKPGIYVDIVTGEPLFSSHDKFDSGSGWPSFTKPLEEENIVDKKDFSHMMVRTEVKSKEGDSHLGHVFDDGPGPEGKRYCINSAALKFIPVDDLEKEGYGQYKALFTEVI